MRLPHRIFARKSSWIGLLSGLLTLPMLAAGQPGASLEGAAPGGPTAVPKVGNTPVPVATAPMAANPAVTPVEPANGTVSADRVYVRPTPSTQHYQLVQLKKDETVKIVGQANGWYQIEPPAGVYCLIVKDYVELSADQKNATVKADFVNVRAGSALQPNRSDIVLSIVRKGTTLTVQGTADIGPTKYLKITPPEKTYVYVSSQFVKTAGALVPAKAPATSSSTITPGGGNTGMIDIGPGTIEGPTVAETKPATTEVAKTPEPPVTPPAATQTVKVVPPAPAATFNAGAYEKYLELNKRTVAESNKPLMERDAGALLEEWNGFLKTANLSPSLKKASEDNIEYFNKVLLAQKAQKDTKPVDDATVAAQRAAVKETYDKAIAAIKDSENSGPYLAEGRLETSQVVVGRYALVNPITRRVVAYIEPSSELPLEALLGQYIGVRGVAETPRDADVKVIKVLNATMIPAPKLNG